jgi:RNA-splicing ligase RtcB
MSFKIEGEYNTATVHTNESKEEAEDSAVEQIEDMVNHKGLEGDDSISIAPDFHWGAGCVIGFSMPLTNKIIPNVVGLDIGCGMTMAEIKDDVNINNHDEFDQKVRESIPMGFDVNDFETSINIKEDFYWEKLNSKFDRFKKKFEEQVGEEIDFDGYDIDYFKDLCDKVNYDTTRAIQSVGSLGDGNHFIEVLEDTQGNKYVIIHSGSRGLGADVAEYHQSRAIQNRKKEKGNEVEGGFTNFVDDKYEPYVNDDMSFKKEKIREDFDGEEIDKMFGELGNAKGTYKQKIEGELNYDESLAYLKGEEAHEYYIDMMFCQMYAEHSRKEMISRVMSILDADYEVKQSVHNYIDFHDLTIRKGCCPARESQEIIIPFNMRDGAVIAEGKGNDDWNQSAPHGAGRNMGRREAHRNLDYSEFESEMEEINGKFTEEMLDEAPMAYKETQLIKEQIKPTAEIKKELSVIHNIKAE